MFHPSNKNLLLAGIRSIIPTSTLRHRHETNIIFFSNNPRSLRNYLRVHQRNIPLGPTFLPEVYFNFALEPKFELVLALPGETSGLSEGEEGALIRGERG